MRLSPFLFATCLMLFVGIAHATTRYVDASHCPSGDGKTWNDAYCSIQEAIAGAAPGDNVFVRTGRYAESLELREGINVYGGFAGTEASPEERDIEANECIIDGSGAPRFQPCIRIEEIAAVVLDGFTVVPGAPNSADQGIVAQNLGPDCAIRNVKVRGFGFQQRTGSLGGSPLGADLSFAPITIEHCEFSNNSGYQGAAIAVAATVGLRIRDCVFRGNIADYSGGALQLIQCGIEIKDCHFENCSAPYGGAIYATDIVFLNISDCSFRGNSAREVASDIALRADGDPPYPIANVQRCQFLRSSTLRNKASVYVAEIDSQILDCVFAANSSTIEYDGGKHNLSQCTFSGNQDHCIRARGLANVTLNNSIFSETADSAIKVENAQVFPGNCLFYRNLADMEVGANVLYRTVEEVNANVLGATANIAGEPGFRNVADFDFRLLASSAAIDAANAIYATYTDFDNKLRPGVDGGIEIGAYEIGDFTAPEVASITRFNASPNNLDVVQFEVRFSEPVEGVDLHDFALDTASVKAIVGAKLLGLGGSGENYTVYVATGTDDGTLRLQLIDDGSIADPDGNPLGGPATGDGDFTTGEVYTIDRTAPVITLVGNNPVDVPVGNTYNEAGATAQDSVDGDLTGMIATDGAPDTTTPETYEIDYSVSDAAGNEAFASRTVNVLPEADFYVTPAAQFIANAATTVTFDVYNLAAVAQNWQAEVIEGTGWCSITAGVEGTSPHGEISTLCLANNTRETRSARIRVSTATKSALPITVTIVQSPSPKALFACNGDGVSTALTYGDALLVLLLAAVLLSPRRAARH